MTEESKPSILIGGVPLVPLAERTPRISALIWGPAGLGKTTLAATFPGKKLIVNFDPDGPASLYSAPDITIADLSKANGTLAAKFKDDNPLGLRDAIAPFDTIVIDSLSHAAELALDNGIKNVSNSKVEKPAIGSYQYRNNLTLKLIANVLRVTAEFDPPKHVVFIAHENTGNKNDDGAIMSYTLLLGGDLPSSAPNKINEVWCLFDAGQKGRMIMIRKARMREPMKTRMFNTMGEPEFEWRFDPEKWEGMKVEDWYNDWRANGYRKIPLPKVPVLVKK